LTVAYKIREAMERASWIRRMFEDGARMKQERGEDKVFDFSLGNPCLDPPPAYLEALREELRKARPARYAYMPNAGYLETRAAVAADLREKRGTPFDARHIVMTCGAAGGLNVVLKTLLNPGDEVLILAPFFPEYLFYVGNHGGVARIVETGKDFSLSLDEIEQAISERTRAILVNSPNNPTGRMYDEASLVELGRLLEEAGKRLGTDIYLVSDEPYAEIVFDGAKLPNLFACYTKSILVNSYSKSLSIAGDRLGYIAVHPEGEDPGTLVDGMVFCNRTLGFVNAPATPQQVISRTSGIHVESAEYERRRDLLCRGLDEAGYHFIKPEGAFYLFPESPVPEEIPFVQELLEEGVLVVPGTGFGRSGHFRIAYCVEEKVIEKALPVFDRVLRRHRTG
jgi:aspartate aminotransferase